ncbi:MAG: GatB/YqeY domain-containing protein [Enterocloster sp.]
MSKIELVRAAMVEAMKAKDKDRKDSLSMLLSALKNAEIDKRSPLTEDEANAVIKKELKQTKETMDTAPADRTDIIEEARKRMEVYQEFAPADWTVDQITEIINGVLKELEKRRRPKIRDDHEGLNAPGKGKGDGKVVNEVLAE